MKQLSIYDCDALDHHPSVKHEAYRQHHQQLKAIEISSCGAQPLAQDKPTTQAQPAQANVTEIIIAKDKADSVQMVLPMLTHLSQEQRWLAWIDPPMQLLKQWRATPQNWNTNEIMILRSNDRKSALELSEQALNAGTCHAVIVWTEQLKQDAFARLEQASAQGNSHGIVLRYR